MEGGVFRSGLTAVHKPDRRPPLQTPPSLPIPISHTLIWSSFPPPQWSSFTPPLTDVNAGAELLVHQVVYWYDKLLRTNFDMDSERGMGEEEEYYLSDSEIIEHLTRASFKNITKRYFGTQWGLNHLFVAWK